MAGDQDLLTLDEAARYLRVGRTCLYERVRTGEIPATKLGRAWVFSRRQLLALVEQRASAMPTPTPATTTADREADIRTRAKQTRTAVHKRPGGTGKLTADQRQEAQRRVLTALRDGATIVDACEVAHVSTVSCGTWRKKDPAFSAEVDRAMGR